MASTASAVGSRSLTGQPGSSLSRGTLRDSPWQTTKLLPTSERPQHRGEARKRSLGSVGSKLCDLGSADDVSDTTPKAEARREQINTSYFIKIKNASASKDSMKGAETRREARVFFATPCTLTPLNARCRLHTCRPGEHTLPADTSRGVRRSGDGPTSRQLTQRSSSPSSFQFFQFFFFLAPQCFVEGLIRPRLGGRLGGRVKKEKAG